MRLAVPARVWPVGGQELENTVSTKKVSPLDREPHRRRCWLRAPLLLLVIVGALPTTQCLRRDEVECEEAVAYLDECCAGFEPKQIRCSYDPGCDHPTYPNLLPEESECILGSSCAELGASQVCKRLLDRNVAESRGAAGVAGADDAVCP